MITIKINTSNAAFSDGNRDTEIARILERLAREWYSVGDGHKLRDVNGNTIGAVTMTGPDRKA